MGKCLSCILLRNSDTEVKHERRIRCPHCERSITILGDWDYSYLHDEGCHIVICDTCDKEFKVNTEVAFTFTSPALVKDQSND